MKAITQHYYGTTEEWLKYNPVVYKAVFAFEVIKRPDGTIYRKAKVGDGKLRWSELPYILDESIFDTLEKIQQKIIAIEKVIYEYHGEAL